MCYICYMRFLHCLFEQGSFMNVYDFKITAFEKIKRTYFTKDFILFVFCGGMGTLTNFIVSYIPNFLILFTFVLIFLNLLHWNKVIVYALAGLLGLPLTFLLVKMMVFKNGSKR